MGKDHSKSIQQSSAEEKEALVEKWKRVAEWRRWLKSPDGKRAVLAWTVGIVGLFSWLVLMQLGINATSKPVVAVEPTPITFPCAKDDPAAIWMRYHLEGEGPDEQDDKLVVASFFDPSPSGRSAVVGGTVFESNPGQESFRRRFIAPQEGQTIVDIKDSCPVLPVAPTPVPAFRP
jgi:hypothetical protein